MKKIVSLLLTLSLLLGLGTTAWAASGMKNFKGDKTYTGFTDVAENAWYYTSVKSAFEYGLVKGAGATTYNPTGSLTVAEAIVMADRIHTLYKNGKDTLQNGSPWYQPYVDYAIKEGIITSGSFDSYTRSVTRAEMADIFSRALPEKEYTVINKINDSCPTDIIGHKYESVIRTLYRAGILTGNDAFGTFTPDQGIVRSEAAAIVSRIVDVSLRRQVELLKQWSYENVSVGIAFDAVAGTTDKATADGGLELMTGNSGVMIYKTKNISGGKAGMTILDVSQEELRTALAAGLGGVELNGTRMAFGNIPAYRFDFEMGKGTEAEQAMSGSLYVWMQGTDMMMTVATVLHDGTAAGRADVRPMLADMVNSITVSGNSPSVKLAK
ncbi:MAG: S-layer homology domain-containing protein [Clostridia bacterium]|nr:S-layer homology domain-containing protein [Clostridia bacterium]